MAAKNLKELADSFNLFDTWEDRYRYLIDMGERMEPMDSALKSDDLLVRGCTSRVWLIAESRKDEQGRTIYHFTADSDSQIIKGLIYILMIAYQDKTAEEIAAVNIEEAFEEFGLSRQLSPNRRNGFFAMVQRIKALSA